MANDQVASTPPQTETTQKRRLRLVPPAVTPLSGADLAAGVVAHLQGNGRAAFREEICAMLDAESAGTYTSFRRALAACLRRLATARDDQQTVLVPSFCSSDYPAAIEGIGLEIQRYDVDPDTLSADLDSLAVEDDVLAVVAVNVLGYSSPMDELADRCDQTEAFLVEALGYGLGTTYRGDRLGTFGDCSVLNFQQGKPIPVGGGMVVSQRSDLEFRDEPREAVEMNVGILAGYTACSHPLPYGLYSRVGKPLVSALGQSERVSTHPESKMAVEYEPPFRTMSNFQGAVGCRVIDQLPDHRRKREAIAQLYANALTETAQIDQIEPVDGLGNHQHVRYPVLFETAQLRERVQDALAESGIQATVLYDWPQIDAERYPGGASLQEQILTLPTHPYVSDADRQRVVSVIRQEIRSEKLRGNSAGVNDE